MKLANWHRSIRADLAGLLFLSAAAGLQARKGVTCSG